VKPQVTALLLAAGRSSRMRGQNKLLLKLADETFIRHAANLLTEISVSERLLVLPPESNPDSAKLRNEVKDFPLKIVISTETEKGMHASIRAGLKACSKTADAFLILFGDQPFLTAKALQRLINTYPEGQTDLIFYPRVDGKRKQPVLIGSSYLPEILKHADGDFGCAYLFKHHPEKCIAVDFPEDHSFEDIDTPETFTRYRLHTELAPELAFHKLCMSLTQARKPYVVATVIEVIGSSSAKTGSKAIFDQNGINLWGWVGGGCAEQFVAEEARATLTSEKSRIINADLDDEIFGLGVACGGSMNLFLEPVLPPEKIRINTDQPDAAAIFAKRYGWEIELESGPTESSLFIQMAQAVARERKTSGKPMRTQKNLSITFTEAAKSPHTAYVKLIGSTRITEALKEHFDFIGVPTQILSPLLKPYGEEDGPEIPFARGELVIVASHTSQDPAIVVKALEKNAAYVAMVGSRKRAFEVVEKLNLREGSVSALPLFVPAGLDIGAKNPEEVALSIVAECLMQLQLPIEQKALA
jgi:xanthine dehydrogenase accessory factor